MIRIETEPWQLMVEHARATYPNECCGAMLGSMDGENKIVLAAVKLDNAFEGVQARYYQLRR
jgi:proteasome lid subunit RPN8/RPN11